LVNPLSNPTRKIVGLPNPPQYCNEWLFYWTQSKIPYVVWVLVLVKPNLIWSMYTPINFPYWLDPVTTTLFGASNFVRVIIYLPQNNNVIITTTKIKITNLLNHTLPNPLLIILKKCFYNGLMSYLLAWFNRTWLILIWPKHKNGIYPKDSNSEADTNSFLYLSISQLDVTFGFVTPISCVI
jgi:hypothetical protein